AWVTYRFAIASNLRDRVHTLTFDIGDGTSAEVDIDGIRLSNALDTSTALDGTERSNFLAGLQSFITELGGLVSQGVMAIDLPFVGGTVGDAVDFVQGLQSIHDQISAGAPTTIGALADLLNAQDIVEFADPQLNGNELTVTLGYRKHASHTVAVDLGAGGDAAGVSVSGSITFTGSVPFQLTLAVRTDGLSFFMRSGSFVLDVAAQVDNLNASVNLAFLSAGVTGGEVHLGAQVAVAIVDPTGDGTITGADLSGISFTLTPTS